MKFNTNKFLAVLAVASLGVACNKEQLQDEIPSSGNGTVQVVVSLDNSTRSFTDAEGVKWEVGDQIKYAGGVNLTSEPLTAEQISDGGYTATFTFASSLNEVDRTGWFYSTKCHPTNDTEVEFTLGADNGNVFIQAEAGQMNTRYLFLHSGTKTIKITKDVPPEVNMEIAGTIFRVIPYTETYNDEKVLSVKLSSNTELVGTVSYDRGAGTYKGVNDVNWKKYNFVKATLGTAFSLEGVTSAETSKGIYLAVAATPEATSLNGYQYEVETDKANYVFSAMDKTLAVGNNAVKNVFLNLDKATSRTEGETGQLKYEGALNVTQIAASGCTNLDAGFWKALTSTDGGSTWTDKINSENSAFYSNVQFTYADDKSGDAVDWISVVYGGSDVCHWLVTAQENTGEERSVKVTATYSDVKGYKIIDDSKTKEWTFTQSAAGSKKVVEYESVSLPASREFEGTAQDNINVGYCLLRIDGVANRDWTAAGIYARSHFAYVSEENYAAKNYTTDVDWLTCQYANNGNSITDCVWLVSATENTTAERTAYVVCVFPEDEGYQFPEPRALKITQKAGLKVEAAFSGFPTKAVAAAGGTVKGKLSLTVNGEPASDIKSTMSTYGLSLSVNKGATATVDASGNVEVVIPENKYKNGGVEYTLSLNKSDGSVAASVVIKQKEGTEEGEPTCPYTYELQIVKNDGEGFGMGANLTGDHGNWAFIRNIKKDGVTVTLTQEIAEEVLAFAYRGMEPSDSEKAQHNQTSKVASASAVVPVVRWFGGVQIDVTLNTGASNQITKIVGYNSDGTEFGSFFVWID